MHGVEQYRHGDHQALGQVGRGLLLVFRIHDPKYSDAHSVNEQHSKVNQHVCHGEWDTVSLSHGPYQALHTASIPQYDGAAATITGRSRFTFKDGGQVLNIQ